MIIISDAGNTYNLAIHLIIKENYQVIIPKDEDIFVAEKNDQSYKADCPLCLLSIINLKEKICDDYLQSIHIDSWTLLSIKELLSCNYNLCINNEYSAKWFSYVAKKRGVELIAQNPLKIYGLHLLVSVFGDAWREQNIPNYLHELYK